MTLFSGSSNPTLAKALVEATGLSWGEAELSNFPNEELKISVGKSSSTAYLLQSFSSPVNSHIIEYCLMADAIKRQGARELVSIIPWYGYSKQDKVFQKGQPLSAKVIAKLIQTTGTEHVITVNLHNPSITGYFDIPVTNINAFPLFIKHLNGQKKNDTVVVSPDAGALKDTTTIAHQLNLPLVSLNKKRDAQTGQVSILGSSDSVKDKHILLFDDMVATGSTLLKTSQYLKEQAANSITVCATHHLYINGVQEKLDNSPITTLFVTDTIQKPNHINSKKLQTISISPLLKDSLPR